MDNDGYQDYIFGNHGLNSRLVASKEEPIVMYKGDLDQNQSNDPIIGKYIINKSGEKHLFPLHSRDDIIGQVPKIKNRFTRYDAFGKATLTEILETEDFENDFLMVDNLSSCYLKTDINGFGLLKPLPIEAQMAPIHDILVDKLVSWSKPDILLVGNDFTREKTNGWQDASNGLVLTHDLKIVPIKKTGFLVSGDARKIVKLKDSQGSETYLVGQNSGPFLEFSKQAENHN